MGAAAPKASPSPSPAASAKPVPMPEMYLLPGRVTGRVVKYQVRKGDRVSDLAVRYTVHPVRIFKPSAEALRNGLQYGETITIDTRRITPVFLPHLQGIVLNIPEAEVYLVKDGKLVKDYPVGVSQGDKEAPIGETHVVCKVKDPSWVVPKSIQDEMREKGLEVKTEVSPGPDNPLGPRYIGFADGTFGFHGTNVRASIKRYASHGCVRFLREDIVDLFDRVKVGMPVHVYYQPVLLAADKKAVWLSVYPDPYDLGYPYEEAVKRLVKQARVENRVHWDTISHVLQEKDGILVDVSRPLPKRPVVVKSPQPSPTPTATPSAAPSPEASAPAPSPTPSAVPSPVLSAPSKP